MPCAGGSRLAWLFVAAASWTLCTALLYALLQSAAPHVGLRALASLTGVVGFDSLRRALRPRKPPDTLGSALFAAPPKGWRRKGIVRQDRVAEPGSVYIGDYRREKVFLPHALSLRHALILGPTGSGKSHGLFLPNMARRGQGTLICTDPKSELWRFTAGLHDRVLRFAPGEPDASAAFNWIPLCGDARMAERIARAIVESGNTERTEQVWLDLEAALLSSLFSHAATLEIPTPLSAYRLLTRLPPDGLLSELETSSSEVAQEQANLLQQTTERIRGSVIPVVAARLQFLRDPAIIRFTSSDVRAPNFKSLRREEQVVYWCLSEQEISRLRPLSAAFFTVLLEELIAPVGSASDSLPVTLFLDEFAAVGSIPDFATLIAVARGRGLAFWLGLQSLAQLELRYGKPAAQTILTNCQTKLVLPGLDLDSAEWVSRSLGQETRRGYRRSWHSPFWSLLPSSHTFGDAEHARALLTGDEVRRLPGGEHLALVGNLPPMRLARSRFVAVLRPPPTRPLTTPQPIEITGSHSPFRRIPPNLPPEFHE